MQMKIGRNAALAALIVLGAGVAAVPDPADAQGRASAPTLSKAEREALFRLQSSFDAGDFAGATAALVAAKSVASGPDARFYAAQYEYQIGVRTNNYAMQSEGLEAMIASGRVPAQDLPALYSQLGSVSYNYMQSLDRAERYIAQQVELAPNDPVAIANLARVKRDRKKYNEALPLLVRAIAARRASGQPAPDNWYKMGIDMAYAAKNGPQAAALGRELVSTYPSPENWRDVLLIQRDLQAGTDPAMRADLYRLLRATKGLSGERDYYDAAAALQAAGAPAEAQKVVQEGVSTKMVDPGKVAAKDYLTKLDPRITRERGALAVQKTRALAAAAGGPALAAGDAYLGFGEYTDAASLYRAAVQKGSVDADLATLRLGIALALGGQRAEAEAALRAVSGARGDLAGYWLAWLARSA
jgi:hypothetical protein